MSSLESQHVLDSLRRFESPNVTFLSDDGKWPIVWDRARGMKVWDADGKEYLDFTSAFGVAAAGHAPPSVVRAGKRQMDKLLHAMGDVHPHALKAKLAQRLSELTFGRWSGQDGKVVFCNGGSESVEVALKTACQATSRRRIVSFEGAYHGLGYGALVATHRSHFRGQFSEQIASFGRSLPFPRQVGDLISLRASLLAELDQAEVGAVLVEPIQGRGGILVPPNGFLKMLREVCDASGTLLIMDEVYTGFGRVGTWFACEHETVVPDLVCLGKALTGGFPLSALVGRADLMDEAWPKSRGEAIHTSTYLGHPVGCAMALAQLDLIEQRGLIDRSARVGKQFKRRLEKAFRPFRQSVSVRGEGLMLGVEMCQPSGAPDGARSIGIIETMLAKGYILLPDGAHGEVVGITPPLIVSSQQVSVFVETFRETYEESLAV